jgi:hypothetical protein
VSQFTVSAWAADSQNSAPYSADQAGDGRFSALANERWQSASTAMPHWLRVDLGTAQAATWYRVDPGRSGTDPTAWTFQGTNDGTFASWTTLDTQSSQSFADTRTKTFSFTNTTAYRYYRVHITAGASSAASFAELELGDGGAVGAVWEHVTSSVTLQGGDFTTGLVFVVNSSIDVSHLNVFCGTNNGTWDARIRDSSGTVVASASVAYVTSMPAGWYELPITPITLAAGTYMVESHSPLRYAQRVGTHSSAVNYGPGGEVTIPQNGTVSFRGTSFTSRQLGGDVEPTSNFTAEAIVGFKFQPTAAPSTPVGTGSGSFTWVGAAAGVTSKAGTGTGAFAWTGTAAGSTVKRGTATGSFAWSGAAVGNAPTVGVPEGSGSGAFAWAGVAVGSTVKRGTASGAFAWAGAAVGSAPDGSPGEGSAAGTFGWTGVAVGSDGTDTGPVTVSTTRTPVGILSVVPLLPVEPLATAVPVTRVSVLAPDLSAVYPAHPAPGEAGAPDVVEEIVGYPQLFIGGENVTNLRGVQTIIRRWESEAPFGDTAAAFEFPQFNPWDVPGEGDLAFLARDARVAIGMREEVAPGAFRVRRLWSGFLDARGNGLGEGEDYAWEAKGTFWQAASQIREPHPLPASEPVDIGVWIARVLNAVEGRRWATMPLVPIGITTMTRGNRDQYVMDYVQELLSEAITDDFRQWSLVEVAPGIPRLVLKPAPSTVHATVAYGTPGVDVDLRVDESTRVDRIFMRGIGRNGGGWAHIHYPWLYKIDDAPDYPLADPGDTFTLGMVDADTVSGSGVTDFQRRVDELDGFSNPAVSGVMSAAWVAVVDDLQRRLNLPVGPLNAATWDRVFDGRPNLEGIKPRRLPMASKPEAEKYLYTADGKRLPGVNPEWDGRVPRDIAIDAGVGKSKSDGFKLARKLLGMYGEPAANGQIVWVTDPRETDRTRLSHLSNVKVTGFEGGDRVVQVSEKSVVLDMGRDEGPVYVVTTRVDERARDAMVVEDLLNQRREAKADPSRRPGVTNRASRQVADQRTPWDSESPCGKLRRTFVPDGEWRIRHIPFAEVGKLASISIDSTLPFSFAIFASLRITEAHLNAKGSPFAVDDFWRDNKAYFDEFGIIEAWGQQDDACGYSPKTEPDDAPFTGEFRLDTPVDYWTETPPVVAVAFYLRGGSGWVEGGVDVDGVRRGFIPAYEGS